LSQANDHLAPGPGVVRRSHEQVYRPELRLLQPKGFADAALDRVTVHRFRGMSARDEKTQPCRTFFAPSDVKRVAGNVAPHPLAEQPLEIARSRDPQLLAQPESRPALAFKHAERAPLDGEALAALGATRAQHRPPAARTAADAKSVAPRTSRLRWLVRSLHRRPIRKRAVLERAVLGIVKSHFFVSAIVDGSARNR